MEIKDLPQDAIKGATELANNFTDDMVAFGVAYHSIGKTTDVHEMYKRTMAALVHLGNCKRQLQGILKILELYKDE
jgi:hypothetical protein